MAQAGDVASLVVVRMADHGAYLDAGEMGEVLLPRREVPPGTAAGHELEVFLYTDSEDRPVATLLRPKLRPGEIGPLRCVDVGAAGAFFDWGLPKDLFVPYREQEVAVQPGSVHVLRVERDSVSGRMVGSARLSRHLEAAPRDLLPGREVDLLIWKKTPLGYKAVVDGRYDGMLFHDRVFEQPSRGDRLRGWVRELRADGKIDLSLEAPGRARIDSLAARILAELAARGGFLGLCDDSPPGEIRAELGASKRAFKQAVGQLLKQGKIRIGERGIHAA